MQKHTFGRLIALVAVASTAVAGWSQKGVDLSSSKSPLPVINYKSSGSSAPQDWTLRPRTPIQFTPFEMVDPTTGKPLNPDDVVEFNGAKITIKELFQQLNAMEQWLNQHGYSLRDNTPIEYYSPTLEAERIETEEYIKWLEENAPLDGSVYGQSGDFSTAGCANYSDGWNSNWLGNWIVAVRLGSSLSAQACLDDMGNCSANVSGAASLHGRLLGREAEVVRVTGSADANSTRIVLRADVYVFGRHLWGDGATVTVPHFDRTWDREIARPNWSTDPTQLFSFGFLCVNVSGWGQLSLVGNVGLRTTVRVNACQQEVSTGPVGRLDVSGRAWVTGSICIASVDAGLRGTLNAADGSLALRLNGYFGHTDQSGFFYRLQASLVPQLTILRGRIDWFANACLQILWWRFCREFSGNLIDWPGWRFDQPLVFWDRTLRL